MQNNSEKFVRAGARYLVAAGAIALLGSGAIAETQSSSVARALKSLELRIAADDARIVQLQRQISATQTESGVIRVADLFGESDEEKAKRIAAEQKEQAQDASIASLNQRVSDLEDTLRKLTGQMEELDHRVSEFNAKIDHMQRDFDYKLCTVVQQQMGASSAPGDQNALPCPGQAQSQAQQMPMPPSPEATMPPADNAPIHLAPPPGVLGTIPQGTVLPQASPPQPGNPTEPAPAENRAQFDVAMNMLARAQYSEASGAFRSFADTYPKDELTPQAIYWIGDIAFVQKDFPNAARAFAEELKKFPTSPRAPQSMLMLGQSLIAMNQKKEGCTALAALKKSYPTASKNVEAQALIASKAAACR